LMYRSISVRNWARFEKMVARLWPPCFVMPWSSF
jgi:hypothetical protein